MKKILYLKFKIKPTEKRNLKTIPVKKFKTVSLAPWKKSYDQPRQHIKKQRHYFANRSSYSQSYGFSSSHVWM